MNLNYAMAIVLADSLGETKRTENNDLYWRARGIVAEAGRAAIALDTNLFAGKAVEEKPISEPPWKTWMDNTRRDGAVQGLLHAKRIVGRNTSIAGPVKDALMDAIAQDMAMMERGGIELHGDDS